MIKNQKLEKYENRSATHTVCLRGRRGPGQIQHGRRGKSNAAGGAGGKSNAAGGGQIQSTLGPEIANIYKI